MSDMRYRFTTYCIVYGRGMNRQVIATKFLRYNLVPYIGMNTALEIQFEQATKLSPAYF